MANYCLDSNAVSDILRGAPEVIHNMAVAKKNNDTLFIPSIVYYEVVRGLKIANKTHKLSAFHFLYNSAEHLSLNEVAIEKAVDIYIQLHNGRLIEDNDIYIAAISMVNDCTLVTANVNHFGRVEGLNFVNWRTA